MGRSGKTEQKKDKLKPKVCKVPSSTTTVKKATEPSKKEEPKDTKYYTCLWSAHERSSFQSDYCNENGLTGFHLCSTGNAKHGMHHKLRPGDVYFPLALKKNKLFVLGKLYITDRIDTAELRQADVGEWMERHRIHQKSGRCYSPTFLLETDCRGIPFRLDDGYAVEDSVAQDLQWVRPNGDLRSGKINTAGLNGVYRLSRDSAMQLEGIVLLLSSESTATTTTSS